MTESAKSVLNHVYYFAFFLITPSYLGFPLISFFYDESSTQFLPRCFHSYFLLSRYQKTLSETVKLCCPDFVCKLLRSGNLSHTFQKLVAYVSTGVKI
jgi:hypothetical protein